MVSAHLQGQCIAGLFTEVIRESGGATEQLMSEHGGAQTAHCPRRERQAGSPLLHVCDGTFWERCPLPLKNKRDDVEEAG